MRKLAIVGIVLSGVLMSAAIAQAKPVGMSKAEYRALVIRSEGLNQKYGVAQQSQQPLIIRQKLGEIGLWAVPSTSKVASKPLSGPSQRALIREKLGEIGLWAVPSKPTARVTSSSDGFGWNNAGIGVGLIIGFVLLGLASVVTTRRHDRPVAH
jgi:hypothetical protein